MLGANLDHLPARRTPFHPCTCCPTNVTRAVRVAPRLSLRHLPGRGVGAPVRGLDRRRDGDAAHPAHRLSLDGPCRIRGRLRRSGGAGGSVIFVRVPAWCRDPSIVVDGRAPTEPTPASYAERVVRGTTAPGSSPISRWLRGLSSAIRVSWRTVVASPSGVGRWSTASRAWTIPEPRRARARSAHRRTATAEHRPGASRRHHGRPIDRPRPDRSLLRSLRTVRYRRRTVRFANVDLTLVPYYAWVNRVLAAMTVWLRRR